MTRQSREDELRAEGGLCDADFGYPAWRGFLSWAIAHPEFRAAFTQATGIGWPAPPRSGLDAMIDDATKHHDHVVEEFVLWATETHWGEDEAPPDIREKIAGRRALEAEGEKQHG